MTADNLDEFIVSVTLAQTFHNNAYFCTDETMRSVTRIENVGFCYKFDFKSIIICSLRNIAEVS